ncbi:MAG: tRNA uridine-5-carboxymethylaminomethyl(34) synthesis GTPase MnmE [Mollicutes bacterium]|nr:tRNA uridine-5-carboxymethylaminomethyl(34) synthesis GTPase MnmE [Mollicutes bacterium]
MEDTIVAIATPLGTGAISIIKISGSEAIEIVSKVFKGKNLNKQNSHTIHYGFIMDEKEKIDEVLVSLFLAPKTYTKEDIVEINCHGGIATTNRILEVIIKAGARFAEPGEFTKRAYLNGRIDLIEAEGVMDLIEAKTEKMRKVALNQLDGNVSKKINELRENIKAILANIEVNIDYPEYEDEILITNKMIKEQMKIINTKIAKIVSASQQGKIIKEGIKVLILGKPNVGKSSILNKLLNENKAIVTNIPGTTRDIVEGTINIEGILFKITDTAGIRKTNNLVEKIGVKKSVELISESDLIIYTIEKSKELDEEDIKIIKKIKNKPKIIFLNKNDSKIKSKEIKLKNEIIVEGNTIEEDGLKELKEKIINLFKLDKLEEKDFNFLTNSNQIALLKKIVSISKNIDKKLEENFPIDIIEIDIKEIFNILGFIIGENGDQEIINYIFKNFCLGK